MMWDVTGSNAVQVAKTAVEAYRELQHRLTDLGLKVNPKKTAFIATDKQTEQALKGILQEHEPPISTVMRDLGIDHQAARRRRIPVLRQRLQKAKQRRLKLRTLKIPAFENQVKTSQRGHTTCGTLGH